MPILCKASEQHIQPDVPSSGMVPSGAAPTRQGPFALRPDAASLPVRGYPYRPFPLTAGLSPLRGLFSLRSPNQPIGLLPPPCGNWPAPALRPPQRTPAPSPAPARKNRNFLDLWQTIAQDLSRLFAVPGCCPPCSGSPKGWPGLCHRHELATGQGQSLCCFRRPRARSVSVAAAFRKALRATWPEDGARADTDMTTRQGHTPFRRAAPTAPGDRSGMAARGAATQSHGPE